MPWLVPQSMPAETNDQLTKFIGALAEKFDDPSVDRYELVRETLADIMYGRSYTELSERSPMAAFALDPHNTTFEAEYYIVTNQNKFKLVKPLLWFWKCLDQTPLGQAINSGIPIRRMLAERIFKQVGKNIKIFQNVEVSVGYNLEVGDNVTIHRHVFIDDIGGVKIHDNASLSDYVNVYSHTHDVHEISDVTLKETVIGKGVRLTYHSTVLAGTILSDDSMVGSFGLANRNLAPYAVGLGIPAKPRLFKCRFGDPDFLDLEVDARNYQSKDKVRANPDFKDKQPTAVMGKPCK